MLLPSPVRAARKHAKPRPQVALGDRALYQDAAIFASAPNLLFAYRRGRKFFRAQKEAKKNQNTALNPISNAARVPYMLRRVRIRAHKNGFLIKGAKRQTTLRSHGCQ